MDAASKQTQTPWVEPDPGGAGERIANSGRTPLTELHPAYLEAAADELHHNPTLFAAFFNNLYKVAVAEEAARAEARRQARETAVLATEDRHREARPPEHSMPLVSATVDGGLHAHTSTSDTTAPGDINGTEDLATTSHGWHDAQLSVTEASRLHADIHRTKNEDRDVDLAVSARPDSATFTPSQAQTESEPWSSAQ